MYGSVDIAITMSWCVYVGVYVSTWQNENSWLEWLETWHSRSPWQSVEPTDFGFKMVKGWAQSSFQTYGRPFISVGWMQLQSSNFVHKCIKGSYCLQIKNYVGMYLVS